MAELLCLWDSDWAIVKFGLLRCITHLWIRISQIMVRSHSEFPAIISWESDIYQVLCNGTKVNETWSWFSRCPQTSGTDWYCVVINYTISDSK